MAENSLHRKEGLRRPSARSPHLNASATARAPLRERSAFRRALAVLLITAFAVAPAIALGEDNRNLLLIGVMASTPLLLLLNGRLYVSQLPLLAFMLAAMIVPEVAHPGSVRWSTVFYSMMFCSSFLLYEQLLRRGALNPETFKALVRTLLFAYVVVLVIQQACVLFGLPILNVSNYSAEERWKLNSLSAEPSHTARIVALLMFSYVCISEVCRGRKYDLKVDLRGDAWLWVGFLWVMVSIRSATAFMFIPLVIAKLINRRNYVRVLLLVVALGAFAVVLDVGEYQRSLRLLQAVVELDPSAAMAADHSGAMRIAPLMVLSGMLDVLSWDGLLGHGVDSVSQFMSAFVTGVQENFSGGGALQVWYEYGFIVFALFIAFTLSKTSAGRRPLHLGFWVSLVFMIGVNNQITWLCIIILWSITYYERQALHPAPSRSL